MDSNVLKKTQQKSTGSLHSKDKIPILIKKLENDLNACDFKWTLFVAAANSYKYDSLLKPFPNAYVVDKILKINRLREVISTIPHFSRLLCILQNIVNQTKPEENDDITDESIDLLYWCLIRAKDPTLKSVHSSNVSKFLVFIAIHLFDSIHTTLLVGIHFGIWLSREFGSLNNIFM